jgi:putative endonuclease
MHGPNRTDPGLVPGGFLFYIAPRISFGFRNAKMLLPLLAAVLTSCKIRSRVKQKTPNGSFLSRGHVASEASFTWHTFQMYWVYVLQCRNDRSWYIGMTGNLKRRITEHQSGNGSRTTSLKRNWRLIYCEGYIDKDDARGRERFLKSGSGRSYLKKQLRYTLQ